MFYYYIITTLLTILCLILLILRFENRRLNFYCLMMVLLMAIANGGYLALGVAKTLEEAVLANKISYIGGCFVPIVTLFLLCEVANYKVPMWARCIMYLANFIVYGMVLSTGYSKYYYKSVEIGRYKDVATIFFEKGPGYKYFYFILYGYMMIMMAILIYTIAKRKDVSRKNIYTIGVVLLVNVVLFFVGRVIEPNLEIMPATYTVNCWILYGMFRRGLIYNIEDNIGNIYDKEQSFGYVMLDKNFNYLGCNVLASKIVPKLKDLVVDKSVLKVKELEFILDKIHSYDKDNNGRFTYKVNKSHYECNVEYIKYKGKKYGYIVEFRDDTDNWKYLKLLSKYNSGLKDKVYKQNEELREKEVKIKELFVQVITALTEAVDAKDRYTSGHSKRVASYAKQIAKRLGKSEDEQEAIYRAGLLHDIGKIRIPVEIINKPGKLTEEEYDIIKIHPVTGYHILSSIDGSEMISIGAKYHHERYDGKGYPSGIAGENIPEIARILGVADAYDAMASNRSYRSALSQDVVRSEIEKGRGTQFDPNIADIMLQMIDEDTEYKMKQIESMNRNILIVNNGETDNKFIEQILKEEVMYGIFSVRKREDALEVLASKEIDIALIDKNILEWEKGEKVLFKNIKEEYNIPIILITSEKSLDITPELSELGCIDYITTSFAPVLIKEIVYNYVEKKEKV